MKFKIEQSINRKGYPTSSKVYSDAHAEALNEEKKEFPKGYKKLKKLGAKMPANKLMGTHTKSGTFKVSKIVPNRLRDEVAHHESYELKAEKRLRK